jgi:hypothetical protein
MRLIFTDLLLNKILPTPCKDVPIDSNIAGAQRNSNFNEEGSGHTRDGRSKLKEPALSLSKGSKVQWNTATVTGGGNRQ